MFRLILTEKTEGPKTGNFKEILGSYNPHQNEIKFNAERIKHWISNGAQVSDTVHNLLVSQKIIEGKKKNVLPKKTPIVKEEESKPEEAPKEEKPEAAAEETPAEEVKEEKPAEEPKEEKVTEEAPKEEEPKVEEPEAPKEEPKVEEAPKEEEKKD